MKSGAKYSKYSSGGVGGVCVWREGGRSVCVEGEWEMGEGEEEECMMCACGGRGGEVCV